MHSTTERQMMSKGCRITSETQGIFGNTYIPYPPVNKHSNGKSPSWIGNTSPNGGFSIAMLDYRRVHLHLDAGFSFTKRTQVSRTWRNTLEAGPQQLVASNLKVWDVGTLDIYIYIYVFYLHIYIYILFTCIIYISHRIHVLCIYLHLVDFCLYM